MIRKRKRTRRDLKSLPSTQPGLFSSRSRESDDVVAISSRRSLSSSSDVLNSDHFNRSKRHDSHIEQPDLTDREEDVVTSTEKKIEPPPPPTRSLRTRTKHVDYDQKFHPSFDPTFRPNSQATRRHARLYAMQNDDRDDDDDDDDGFPRRTTKSSRARRQSTRSVTLTARELSDLFSRENSLLQDSSSSRRPSYSTTSPSLRRSKRREAQKQVNYDTSVHPQDFALSFKGKKARSPRQTNMPWASPDDEENDDDDDDDDVDVQSSTDNTIAESPADLLETGPVFENPDFEDTLNGFLSAVDGSSEHVTTSSPRQGGQTQTIDDSEETIGRSEICVPIHSDDDEFRYDVPEYVLDRLEFQQPLDILRARKIASNPPLDAQRFLTMTLLDHKDSASAPLKIIRPYLKIDPSSAISSPRSYASAIEALGDMSPTSHEPLPESQTSTRLRNCSPPSAILSQLQSIAAAVLDDDFDPIDTISFSDT